jgi:hypothetical protein
VSGGGNGSAFTTALLLLLGAAVVPGALTGAATEDGAIRFSGGSTDAGRLEIYHSGRCVFLLLVRRLLPLFVDSSQHDDVQQAGSTWWVCLTVVPERACAGGGRSAPRNRGRRRQPRLRAASSALVCPRG